MTGSRPLTGLILLASAAAALWTQAAWAQSNEVSEYRLLCDASAGFALDENHFVVANDELNILRIYRRGQPDPVGEPIPLYAFLDTAADKESDIEGAAAIGNRIYWISSHGRNSSGERQKRRLRFFATDIQPGAEGPSVKETGTAYKDLLDNLLAAPQLQPYGLKSAAEKAPEAEGGFNIEGLAATPDG